MRERKPNPCNMNRRVDFRMYESKLIIYENMSKLTSIQEGEHQHLRGGRNICVT